MIAKGNLHAHGGRLAVYMTTGKDGERAELIEARGFLSDDLREGFCTIQAIAESQTQCTKPFFHTYVRLPEGETLDHAAWLAVADRIEASLGFDGQPRAVAFHIGQDGERHMHTAWSRIDMDDMRAIDPGLYKNKLKELCRELELEYGLQPVTNERAPEQQTKGPARAEFEEARRLGLDVEATREAIRACFDRSDNGPSFAAALGEEGMGLARGDRRDLVVVDPEGGLHALGKRICGVSAADVRARFGPEFQRSLPSVDALRQQMAASQTVTQAMPQGLGRDGQPQVSPPIAPRSLSEHSQDSIDTDKSERPVADQVAPGRRAGVPGAVEPVVLRSPTADLGRHADRGIGSGARAAGKILDAAAKSVERVFGFLDGLFATPEPPRKIDDPPPPQIPPPPDVLMPDERRDAIAQAQAALETALSQYESESLQRTSHSPDDDDGGRIHGHERTR